jgi:hypothetical protein
VALTDARTTDESDNERGGVISGQREHVPAAGPGRRRAARRRSGRGRSVLVGTAVALVLGLVAAVLLLGGAGPGAGATDVAETRAATPPPGGWPRLQLGVVGSQAPQAPDEIHALGAHVMRDEFTAGTTVEQLAPIVDALAARGIRLQPLVGWDDGTPAPDLTAVARWAAAFGPGGTHWAGRSDATAMTDIELGNENAFYYKSGVPDDDRYHALARAYGARAADAARAVHAANPAVGVLVELESADSERSTWIDDTLAAGGPDLVHLMHGPVIHPYGPDWQAKIDRDRGFLRARGVTAPFFVTEWGISSDDGADLSDNYDWPTDLTYDRAGALLRTAVTAMAGEPDRVRQVLLYQVFDQRDPGEDTDREHYFGLVRHDGSDKGGYTAAVRDLTGRYP